MSSEVARLMRQIELSCEAAKRALTGYSITAQHRIISRRYAAIGTYQEQLAKLAGEEKSVEMMVDIYNRTMEDSSE